jgi:hypothetical protein
VVGPLVAIAGPVRYDCDRLEHGVQLAGINTLQALSFLFPKTGQTTDHDAPTLTDRDVDRLLLLTDVDRPFDLVGFLGVAKTREHDAQNAEDN